MRTFCTAQTREYYLVYLTDEAERDIPYDPEPIGQVKVAPGTKVLLLSERDEQLLLDPVILGYSWDDEIARCWKLSGINKHGRKPFNYRPQRTV